MFQAESIARVKVQRKERYLGGPYKKRGDRKGVCEDKGMY